MSEKWETVLTLESKGDEYRSSVTNLDGTFTTTSLSKKAAAQLLIGAVQAALSDAGVIK